jgi:hypothetical protein
MAWKAITLPGALCQVKQQDLRILGRFDCQFALIANGSAVVLVKMFAV